VGASAPAEIGRDRTEGWTGLGGARAHARSAARLALRPGSGWLGRWGGGAGCAAGAATVPTAAVTATPLLLLPSPADTFPPPPAPEVDRGLSDCRPGLRNNCARWAGAAGAGRAGRTRRRRRRRRCVRRRRPGRREGVILPPPPPLPPRRSAGRRAGSDTRPPRERRPQTLLAAATAVNILCRRPFGSRRRQTRALAHSGIAGSCSGGSKGRRRAAAALRRAARRRRAARSRSGKPRRGYALCAKACGDAPFTCDARVSRDPTSASGCCGASRGTRTSAQWCGSTFRRARRRTSPRCGGSSTTTARLAEIGRDWPRLAEVASFTRAAVSRRRGGAGGVRGAHRDVTALSGTGPAVARPLTGHQVLEAMRRCGGRGGGGGDGGDGGGERLEDCEGEGEAPVLQNPYNPHAKAPLTPTRPAAL